MQTKKSHLESQILSLFSQPKDKKLNIMKYQELFGAIKNDKILSMMSTIIDLDDDDDLPSFEELMEINDEMMDIVKEEAKDNNSIEI